MTQSKSAVVTGVSTGIGRAICASLIKDDWHVFGSVRKEEDAEAAKESLGEAFTPLIFDVTDEAAIAAAGEQVEAVLDGRTLGGLINNAGIPAAGPMRYLPLDELRHIMDVNVYGIVRACQTFIPLLGGDHGRDGAPGKIINMSSISGRLSVPFMGPYSISKYGVEALSDAMRVELRPHGIDVVVIEPGPVKTPIFEKTASLNFDQYKDTEYASALDGIVKSAERLSKGGLEPRAVGELVLQIMTDPKPKTRYPILKGKFARWVIPNLLPERLLDRMLARRAGLGIRNR